MERSRLPHFGRKARLPVSSHRRADIIRPPTRNKPSILGFTSHAESPTDHGAGDRVNLTNGLNNEDVRSQVREGGRNDLPDGSVNVVHCRGSDSASIHGGLSDCPQQNNGLAQSVDTIGSASGEPCLVEITARGRREHERGQFNEDCDNVFLCDHHAQNVGQMSREMFSTFGKGSKPKDGKARPWQLGGRGRKLPDPPANAKAPLPSASRNNGRPDNLVHGMDHFRDLVPLHSVPYGSMGKNPSDNIDTSQHGTYRTNSQTDTSIYQPHKMLVDTGAEGHYKELQFREEDYALSGACSPETNKGYVDVQIPNPEYISKDPNYTPLPNRGYLGPGKGMCSDRPEVLDKHYALNQPLSAQSYRLVNKPSNNSVSKLTSPHVNTPLAGYQTHLSQGTSAIPHSSGSHYGYSHDSNKSVLSSLDYQDYLDDSFEHIYEEPLSPGSRTPSTSSEGHTPSPHQGRRPFASPTCGVRMAELRASKRQKSPSPEPQRYSPGPGLGTGQGHYDSNESVGSQYSVPSKMNTIKEEIIEGNVMVQEGHVYHLYSTSLSRQARGRAPSLGLQAHYKPPESSEDMSSMSSASGLYEEVVPASHLAHCAGKSPVRGETPQANVYCKDIDFSNGREPQSQFEHNSTKVQDSCHQRRVPTPNTIDSGDLSMRHSDPKSHSSVPRYQRHPSGSGSNDSSVPDSPDNYMAGRISNRQSPSSASSPKPLTHNMYGASVSSVIDKQSKSSGSSATLTCSVDEEERSNSGDIGRYHSTSDTDQKSHKVHSSRSSQDIKAKVLAKGCRLQRKCSPQDIYHDNNTSDRQGSLIRGDFRRQGSKGDGEEAISQIEAQQNEGVYKTSSLVRSRTSEAIKRTIQRVETFSESPGFEAETQDSEGVYDAPWDLRAASIASSLQGHHRRLPSPPKATTITPCQTDEDQHLVTKLNQISHAHKQMSRPSKLAKPSSARQDFREKTKHEKTSPEISQEGLHRKSTQRCPLLRNLSHNSDPSSSLSSSLNSSRTSLASASSESDASQGPSPKVAMKKKTKYASKLRSPLKNTSKTEKSAAVPSSSSQVDNKPSVRNDNKYSGGKKGDCKAKGHKFVRQSSSESCSGRTTNVRQLSSDTQMDKSVKSGQKSMDMNLKTKPQGNRRSSEQDSVRKICDSQVKGAKICEQSHSASSGLTVPSSVSKYAHARSLSKLKMPSQSDKIVTSVTSPGRERNTTKAVTKLKKPQVAKRSTGTQFEKTPTQERVIFPSKKVLERQGEATVRSTINDNRQGPSQSNDTGSYATHSGIQDKCHKSLPHKATTKDRKIKECWQKGLQRISKLRPPSATNKMQSADLEHGSVNNPGKTNNEMDKDIDLIGCLNPSKTDNDDSANDTERQQTVTHKDCRQNLHEEGYCGEANATADTASPSSAIEILDSSDRIIGVFARHTHSVSVDHIQTDDCSERAGAGGVLSVTPVYKPSSPTNPSSTGLAKLTTTPPVLVKPYASLNRTQPFVSKFTNRTKITSPTEYSGLSYLSRPRGVVQQGGKRTLPTKPSGIGSHSTREISHSPDSSSQVYKSSGSDKPTYTVYQSHLQDSANHSSMCPTDKLAYHVCIDHMAKCVPQETILEHTDESDPQQIDLKKDRDSGYVPESEQEINTAELEIGEECTNSNEFVLSREHHMPRQNKYHPLPQCSGLAPSRQIDHPSHGSSHDKVKIEAPEQAGNSSEKYCVKNSIFVEVLLNEGSTQFSGTLENIEETQCDIRDENLDIGTAQPLTEKCDSDTSPSQSVPTTFSGDESSSKKTTNIGVSEKVPVSGEQTILHENNLKGKSDSQVNYETPATGELAGLTEGQMETHVACDKKCVKTTAERCQTVWSDGDKSNINQGASPDNQLVIDCKEVNGLSTIPEDSSRSCRSMSGSKQATASDRPRDISATKTDNSVTGTDSCQACPHSHSGKTTMPADPDCGEDCTINCEHHKCFKGDSSGSNNNNQTSPSRSIRKLQNVEIRVLRYSGAKHRNPMIYPCHSLPRKVKITAFDLDESQSLSDTECNGKGPEISPKLRARIDQEYQRRKRDLCTSQETIPFGDPSFGGRDLDSNEQTLSSHDMWEIFRDHLGHHGIGIGNIRLSESGYDSWKSQDSGSTIYNAQHDSQDDSTSESSSRKDPDSEAMSAEGSLSRKEISNLKKEQANSESTICSSDSIASNDKSSVKNAALKSSSEDTLLADDQEISNTESEESTSDLNPVSKLILQPYPPHEDTTQVLPELTPGSPLEIHPQHPNIRQTLGRNSPHAGEISVPCARSGDLINSNIDDGSKTPVNQNNPKLFAKTDSDETIKEDDILLDSEGSSDGVFQDRGIPVATTGGESGSPSDNLSPCEPEMDCVASSAQPRRPDICTSTGEVDPTGIKDISTNLDDGVDRRLDIFQQTNGWETEWSHGAPDPAKSANKENKVQSESNCAAPAITSQITVCQASDDHSVTHQECGKLTQGQNRPCNDVESTSAMMPAPPATDGCVMSANSPVKTKQETCNGQSAGPQETALHSNTSVDDNSLQAINSSKIVPPITSTGLFSGDSSYSSQQKPTAEGLSSTNITHCPEVHILCHTPKSIDETSIKLDMPQSEPSFQSASTGYELQIERSTEMSMQDSQDGYEKLCDEFLEGIDSNRSSNSESSACQSTDSIAETEPERPCPPQTLGPILPVLHLNDMPLYLRPDTSPQRSKSSPDIPAKQFPEGFLTGDNTLKRTKATSALNVDRQSVSGEEDASLVKETAVSETSLHVSSVDGDLHSELGSRYELSSEDFSVESRSTDSTGGEFTESDTNTLGSDTSTEIPYPKENKTTNIMSILDVVTESDPSDCHSFVEKQPIVSHQALSNETSQPKIDKKTATVRNLISRLEKKYNFDHEEISLIEPMATKSEQVHSPESKIPLVGMSRKTSATSESRLLQLGKSKPVQKEPSKSEGAKYSGVSKVMQSEPNSESQPASPSKGKTNHAKKTEVAKSPPPSPCKAKQAQSIARAPNVKKNSQMSRSLTEESRNTEGKGSHSSSSLPKAGAGDATRVKSPVIAKSKLGRPIKPRQDTTVSGSKTNLGSRDTDLGDTESSAKVSSVSSIIKRMNSKTELKVASRLPKSDAPTKPGKESKLRSPSSAHSDSDNNSGSLTKKGSKSDSKNINSDNRKSSLGSPGAIDSQGGKGPNGGRDTDTKIPAPSSLQSRILGNRDLPRRTSLGSRKVGSQKNTGTDKM